MICILSEEDARAGEIAFTGNKSEIRAWFLVPEYQTGIVVFPGGWLDEFVLSEDAGRLVWRP